MRRARKTRMGTNKSAVVTRLKLLLKDDTKAFKALVKGDRNYAYGRLANKWLDNESKESVFDRYIDEEAADAVSYALNIVAKEIREA